MPIRRSPALSRAYLTIVKVPLIGGKRKESLRLSIRDIYRARARARARARIERFPRHGGVWKKVGARSCRFASSAIQRLLNNRGSACRRSQSAFSALIPNERSVDSLGKPLSVYLSPACRCCRYPVKRNLETRAHRCEHPTEPSQLRCYVKFIRVAYHA